MRDSLDPVVHHEVILQELPYVHREDSPFELAKDSSADRIDSARRIRCCLPRISGQSLLYLARRYVRARCFKFSPF